MDYSYQDYTMKQILDVVLNGATIIGSCFSQGQPDTQVFGNGSSNITFVNCNLDNVLIPPGSTTEGCSARRILVQPDDLDWIVDENNNPIEPI